MSVPLPPVRSVPEVRPPMPTQHAFRRGDTGPAISEIRDRLARIDLLEPADGAVGPQTYRRLDEARWRLGDRVLTYMVSSPIRGDDVAALQQRLSDLGFDPGYVDGIFGPASDGALKQFQRNMGLPAEGTCGPATLQAIGRLNRSISGGRP